MKARLPDRYNLKASKQKVFDALVEKRSLEVAMEK
jgi:hypothetical protein